MAKTKKAAAPKLPTKDIPADIRKKVKKADKHDIIDENFPYDTKLKNKDYEEQKEQLQIELLKVQRWVQETEQRLVMLFEGRDAAGKGGTIKRFTEHLNPRGARVVALPKPNETEQGQWYFQRYIQHLPTEGEIVLFDRSWYNRAVVEPVMGFCTPTEHQTFLREVPQLESMWVNDGLRLFKFWFSVGRAEQLRRFQAREKDRLKQWKLSPVDLKSLSRWDEYTEAKNSMFAATDTASAPWTVIRSDDKKRARLACMRYVLSNLPYPNKDEDAVGTPDPKIVGPKEQIYSNNEW